MNLMNFSAILKNRGNLTSKCLYLIFQRFTFLRVVSPIIALESAPLKMPPLWRLFFMVLKHLEADLRSNILNCGAV